MTENVPAPKTIMTSIAPWLSVSDGPTAVEYYAAAFGAVERYRLEDDTRRSSSLSWRSARRTSGFKRTPAPAPEPVKDRSG